ncbi:Wzz/FepE/Etk N-terminal domain-containing protein [Comamonas sp. CMM02]|jgi:LPS O-antigen subunit length determinant protein (WzzB/FepE family)|uniref:Wzz/FepE/Etk N-terminal domain-containing protein n=1 Tax=Comamonas sp. CMM02 TaxID=2769307 RepID=UPI001784964A|nr:Wzz/FepE/Etk N-terminal domain-containing protein [Comamonas sp. CMM02]MBD9400292.1 lipopolysaccharide biosynthesis protein [Comamonas sp. CMM02]
MTTNEAPLVEVNSDEIELIDLLIVIAENLKLLIFIPLLVGVATLGFSYGMDKTYQSESMLSPEKPGLNFSGHLLSSYLKSADVLEAVASDIKFEPTQSMTSRVTALRNSLQVSVGNQDQIVTLKTQAQTPEAAQELNASIWQHALKKTVPNPAELERLQIQLKAAKERLDSGNSLEAITVKALANGVTNESTTRLYGELLTSNSALLRNIVLLESQIEGLTSDSFSQKPTLPEFPIKPKKAFLAVVATLGTGLLMLLFVLARQALRSAAQNPEQADKVRRLRRSLGFKT